MFLVKKSMYSKCQLEKIKRVEIMTSPSVDFLQHLFQIFLYGYKEHLKKREASHHFMKIKYPSVTFSIFNSST